MNLVTLIGNLGKDPHLRPPTDSKSAMCTFTLATTERYKDQEYTTWHNVVAFGNQAVVISDHFHKGSKIAVTGRIQNRKYQDKDGKDVYVSEVMVREFEFVERKSQQPRDYPQPSSEQPRPIEDFDDDIPF